MISASFLADALRPPQAAVAGDGEYASFIDAISPRLSLYFLRHERIDRRRGPSAGVSCLISARFAGTFLVYSTPGPIISAAALSPPAVSDA